MSQTFWKNLVRRTTAQNKFSFQAGYNDCMYNNEYNPHRFESIARFMSIVEYENGWKQAEIDRRSSQIEILH